MKNLISIIVFLISSTTFAQEVKVTTDKENYKFDEIIEVTFELNAKYDSISLPHFEGFKLIGAPTKNSVFSIRNGEQTTRESSNCKLRPEKSGRLKINSPTYYIDGRTIEGNPVYIQIASSKLTVEELNEKQMLEFIEDGIKPEGTTRIIMYENRGYIEIFRGMAWEFHRRLTAEELEQIKEIE